MLGLVRIAALTPHAALVGIRIMVGVDIIDWDYLHRVRRALGAAVFFMFIVLLQSTPEISTSRRTDVYS